MQPRISLEEINGISYRKEGKIVENPCTIVPDIDSFSFPQRNKFNLNWYTLPGVIHSSRGCPFQCLFCSASAMAGGKYRMRSVENIMREFDYLLTKLYINFLAFSDDTITGNLKRLKQICKQILYKGYQVKWLCASRVNLIDQELLRLMAQSGCQRIGFGFESASEDILKSINKRITKKQIEKAVKLCLEFGILPSGNFMIGFPNDTKETIKKSLEFAKKLKRFGAHCTFTVLTPFPGTYFYNHAEELGITIHSNDWDDFSPENPIISTRNLSLDELRTIFLILKRI